MMARSKRKTSDAVEILRRRFVEGDPEMEALVRQERGNLDVAQQIYDLRTRAELTQQQLAERVGTTASVICRLEDADYEGHSLSMLRRVAEALQSRVEVRFVPLDERPAKTG
jgi:ribosome-binding protein aMBF1 (putative translation factor)